MPTRKKNAVPPRQGKSKPAQEATTVPALDISTMLMVGDEHIVIDHEEDDNIGFMAELIDTV